VGLAGKGGLPEKSETIFTFRFGFGRRNTFLHMKRFPIPRGDKDNVSNLPLDSMKNKSRLQMAALPLLVILSSASQAAVTVTSSSSAPTITTHDQYYLPGQIDEVDTINGSGTASDINDESTYVAERPSKIMSFTTGNNVGGYKLNSITVQQVQWSSFVNNGTWANIPNGTNFALRFGTISGNTLTSSFSTLTASYTGSTITQNGSSGTGFFLTLDLTGESLADLAANTTYFFEITRGTGSNLYFEMNSTATNGYSGGQAFRGDNGGQLDSDLTVNSLTGDFAFHASLTAVPEPSTALLGGFGLLALLRRRR
jgi:hypothetical protein